MADGAHPRSGESPALTSPGVATRSLRPGSRSEDLVLAAGGIVLRQARTAWEVAVVHRPPPRDDWSLPKGKLDPGETLAACALREVEEETGLRCRLLEVVGTSEYLDRRGRPKEVTYWLMEAVEGTFVANHEVDDMRWLQLDIARQALTYSHDRRLLRLLDTLSLAQSG
jgi:8-oxo-dGTP diphosphatase